MLAVHTVMEKPLPMPYRMRSNKTFQSKSNSQLVPLDDETANVKVFDDNLSKLAIDYTLHIEN